MRSSLKHYLKAIALHNVDRALSETELNQLTIKKTYKKQYE